MDYAHLSKRPQIFRSFTGLEVQEFDAIIYSEIESRYAAFEVKCLSKRKRERAIYRCRATLQDEPEKQGLDAAGLYYRLYITYTLAECTSLVSTRATSAGTYGF